MVVGLGRCLHRIGPDHDRVHGLVDLVRAEARRLRVLADRLRALGLVDAVRAEPAVVLLEDIAPDPAHARVGLVALLARASRRGLELLAVGPTTTPANSVQLHGDAPWSIAMDRTPAGGRLSARLIALATVTQRVRPFHSCELPQIRDRQLRGDVRGAFLGGAGALQHRAGRLRQARAGPPRDGVGGLGGERTARELRRAPGALEP